MASLAPFRFSWTQDRGNGKNPVPASPCPQLQSIALVAAGRNVHSLLHTRRGARSLPGAARFAHNSCGGHLAVDIDDAMPGVARTVRASQENRSLDTPSLVLRLCYWTLSSTGWCITCTHRLPR